MPLMLMFLLTFSFKNSSYARACENDWIEILLEGHGHYNYLDPSIATFKLVETGEVLFSFTSQDPVEERFKLVPTSMSTTSSVLPSLSNVTIDHRTNHITGVCYGSDQQCRYGYVWPYDGLFFELWTNGTVNRMRNLYTDWSWNGAPSVILNTVEPGNKVGDRILQTSVARNKPCQYLKICVTKEVEQRSQNILGPDILVSVGWLLHQFARHTHVCSVSTTV